MNNTDQLRDQLCQQGLSREELQANPLMQLQDWMHLAKSVDIREPDAMVLSTMQDNQPWQRTVLLKQIDQQGLVFFTNYGSRKAQQIETNLQVCALLPWYALQRQVIVHGVIEKVDDTLSESYFQSRSRGSQLGAWASKQSQPLDNRETLMARLEKVQADFEGQSVLPLPPFWGGYRITPTRFEFWQGRQDRLHDRFIYTHNQDNWHIERLYP